jgi:hypothetical protein
MRAMTHSEASEWSRPRGIYRSDKGLLYFADVPRQCVEIRLPEHFTRLAFLSYWLSTFQATKDNPYSGSLLWIRDWDTEGSPIYQIAGALDRNLRKALGSNLKLEETPAHLFGADELIDASGFVLLAFGFQWDAHIVPASGDYLAYKQRDEVVYIVPRRPDVKEALVEDLRHQDWESKLTDLPWFLSPPIEKGVV